MMVAGEGSLETINETVVDKSSQYNAVMNSAGQEVRNLQSMYVDQHRTAVQSAEKLAALPTLAPEAEDTATATRAYRGLDDADNATQYTDEVSEAEPQLVNETTIEEEVQ